MSTIYSWTAPSISDGAWGTYQDSASEPSTQLAKVATATWTPGDENEALGHEANSRPGPYVRGSYLGAGSYGTAYKVKRVSDGKLFAGKSSMRMKELRGEAAILRPLKHDHILKFIDWYEDEVDPLGTLLITELCVGGNLQTQINEYPETVGRKEALQVTVQIASALEYIHGQGLMHSDLKPKNIFLRSWDPVDVVLADCADIRSATKMVGKRFRGTPVYQAPEAHKLQRNYGVTDDIWALGITFLGLLGQWPLRNTEEHISTYAKRCSDHALALKKLNPDHKMVKLLDRMLAWNPASRASAAECVRLAQECLEESRDEAGNEFGIKLPEEFHPRSFW